MSNSVAEEPLTDFPKYSKISVLQRAVAMVLEAIYEQYFLNCSFGFRPGRSTHHALKELWERVIETSGDYVLEMDIKKCFDTLD